MLEATGVTKEFGGLRAVDDVDFQVGDEEIVGLIGPNGAGKTTLFNTITGVFAPEPGGTIRFDGRDLVGLSPHEIAKLGVVRTFQIVRIFEEMTVLENATAGALFGSAETPTKAAAVERGREALAFVGLEADADAKAGTLTVARQKQVELARALATDPDLLMLDEIASGLTPSEVDALTDTIRRIRDERGIGVFWIEHIMDALLAVVDRVIVLNGGKKIADGTPDAVRADQEVAEAYLGDIG